MYQGRIEKAVYIYWKKIGNGDRVPREEASAEGRKLLRQAVLDLYSLNLNDLQIETGEYGKPYIADHPEIEYNISHSGCYVVCAVSGVPVGIDIQEKRVIALDKIGRKIFSPEEYRDFLKSEEKQDVFFRQWARMESYLKWTGEGISKGLKNKKLDGWHQFVHINRNYVCVIWAQRPLSIFMREL